VHQNIIVATQNDSGSIVRRAITDMADRVFQVTTVRLQLTAVIVLWQREIRNIVSVQIATEGFVQLNTITAECVDLGQLTGDVAVDSKRWRGLDRNDLMAIERRRDLISEKVSTATLGSYAEAEARDTLVDDLRLGIKFALRANIVWL